LLDFAAIKEQIRSSVDLVDLVSEHTTLTHRGRNHLGLCPFHDEKTPSFNVNAERQFFKCFGCGKGGDVFTFVQLRESVDFAEALRMLADRAGIDIPTLSRSERATGSSRADIARVNAWAKGVFAAWLEDGTLGADAQSYVERRGISPEMVRSFGIGLAPGGAASLVEAARRDGIDVALLIDAGLCKRDDSGSVYETFRQRLMFPIVDSLNRCIGFGGRTLADAKAKYLNTPQTALFDKSRSLYGIDQARDAISSVGEAIVVEGYTDCIACHQNGFTNAVAALGTAATDSHMALLRRYCDRVILLFDSDAAGRAAADRALAIALRRNLTVKLVSVPGDKDPSDYLQHSGVEGFRNLLLSAEDALLFKWNQARSAYQDGASASDRRRALDEFVALVSGLTEFGALDAIQQGIITTQLAGLLGVPDAEVRQLLNRSPRRREVAEPGPGGRSVVRAEPGNAEQRALVTLLAVVVHEPGLFESGARYLIPDRFADPVHGRIAGVVRELATSFGEFRFSELMSEIEDTGESQVLTDLAILGSQFVDIHAVLDGAVEKLSQIEAGRETSRLASEAKIGLADGVPLNETELDERLKQIGQQLGARRLFAPGRSLNKHASPPAVGGDR
jgi:DNA primase